MCRSGHYGKLYLYFVYSLATVRQENISVDTPFFRQAFVCKDSGCVSSWTGSCVMSLMATTALLFHCLARCVSGCKMLPLSICSIFISSLQFLSLLPTYFCKWAIVFWKWTDRGKWSTGLSCELCDEKQRLVESLKDWPARDLSTFPGLYLVS